VALVSVSVPEQRLNSSLGTLTGAQYIGSTFGPALGAILAALIGFRGAIAVSSLLPVVAGVAVTFLVPSDMARRKDSAGGRPAARQPLEPFHMTFQFLLVIFVYFVVIALNQLIRLATPIALSQIEGSTDVASEAGVIFTLAGIVSSISVLVIAPRVFQPGRLRLALTVACLFAAAGQVVLLVSANVPVYVMGFLMNAAVLSATVPTTNTLIASNVPRARRGTAFGVASSAQALSFAIGPMGAALFAAVSLDFGFVVMAGLMVALALVILVRLREPAGVAGE
jgi:MFS family permease